MYKNDANKTINNINLININGIQISIKPLIPQYHPKNNRYTHQCRNCIDWQHIAILRQL